MAELTEFLKAAVSSGASDLHLVVGKPPLARVNGLMQPMPGAPALGAKHGMIAMNQSLAHDVAMVRTLAGLATAASPNA